jgi:hypothetical protein
MTFDEFKSSLTQPSPPAGINRPLQALWEEAKGDWDTAHRIAQSISDATGAWIHAYLHRREGDLSNAGYWYSCAGKTRPNLSLAEEWEQIVRALL